MPNTPPQPRPPASDETRHRNVNTVAVQAWTPPDLGRLQEGLGLALRTVRAAPSPGAPGVHVFAVRGHDIVTRFLPARGDDHLVLGRHEACDVVLQGDLGVSLRHLLARTVRLDDGTAALRLFDLSTARPFVLEDGTTQRSLVASGPFAVGLGDFVIGGVPTDSEDYGATTRGAPYRIPALVETSTRIPRAALRTPTGRRSRITLLPASRFVTQVPEWPSESHARISLSREGNVASTVVSEDTLVHGVLIGRAERCLDRGFRAALSASISRVHLLLLRDRGRDVLIDLASTQGTYARGVRLRQVQLPSSIARVTLSRREPVELTWDRVNL